MPANVFLVGPMGAGKTTIGRILAEALGLEFVDADHEIERRAGVNIPWIFDKEGEDGFRQREVSVIDDLSQRRGVLLSTGGGAVIREENRRHLSARGTVVYLHTTVDEQLRRTAHDRNRPLLQQGNPRETLEQLFQQRDPLYREIADILMKTDSRGPKAVARDLVERLRG